VIVSLDRPPPAIANQGRAPLAWWDLTGKVGSRTVLASGRKTQELFDLALREWKILTAAALVGLGDGALRLGIDYSKSRYAFGVPIATFQAVSHSLVDAAIAVEGARHMTWKAAWFSDHEPSERVLTPMVFVYASQAATKAVTVAIHVHGGIGLSPESDVTLYFYRAKGWSVVAGDPQAELITIADTLFSPPT